MQDDIERSTTNPFMGMQVIYLLSDYNHLMPDQADFRLRNRASSGIYYHKGEPENTDGRSNKVKGTSGSLSSTQARISC
jgi:hypothetical protein